MWSIALAGVLASCGEPPTPVAVEQPAQPQPEPAPEVDEQTQREAAVEYHAAFELDRHGRQPEALQAVQRALALHRTDDALLLGSKLAISQEKMGQAREWTEELIRRDPDHADALYNLGVIAHRTHKYNEARSSYLAALRSRPSHADARYNLAILTANAGVIEEAKYHRDKLVAEHPDDPRIDGLAKLLGDAPPPSPAPEKPQ